MTVNATEIYIGDKLVNPAHEPAVGNSRSSRHYPIRQVVQLTETEIVLDNGVSVPKLNERNIPIAYRLAE